MSDLSPNTFLQKNTTILSNICLMLSWMLIGLVFFIYYQQRICSTDASESFVKMLSGNHPLSILNRYSTLIVLWLPEIGIRHHFSFETISLLLGMDTYILLTAFFLFLKLIKVPSQYLWLYILSQFAFLGYSFFYMTVESFTMCFPVVFYILIKEYLEKDRKILLLYLSILILLIVASHPLIVGLSLWFLGLFIFSHRVHLLKIIIFICVLILSVSIYHYFLGFHSYEQEKIMQASMNFQNIRIFSKSITISVLSDIISSNRIIFILNTMIIFYLVHYRKIRIPFLYYLSSISFFLIVVGLYNFTFDFKEYQEMYLMPIFIFNVVFIFHFIDIEVSPRFIIFSFVIVLLSMCRIYQISKSYTDRADYIKSQMIKYTDQNIHKVCFPSNMADPLVLGFNCNLPFESYLYGKFEHREFTMIVQDDISKKSENIFYSKFNKTIDPQNEMFHEPYLTLPIEKYHFVLEK